MNEVSKPDFEESLKNVLNAFSSIFDDEINDRYEKLKDEQLTLDLKSCVAKRNGEAFEHRLNKFEDYLESIVLSEMDQGQERKFYKSFFFIQHKFVSMQFYGMIKQKEGLACSADKERTVSRALAKWLLDGKKIEFNLNQEYTYHIPKKVFTTHDEIVSFYDSIRNLYLGRPLSYLKWIKEYTLGYAMASSLS